MDESKYYISIERKGVLEEELKELSGPKRQAILDTLGYAKSLGDLSENAEYHQAREEQSKLEERIAEIEDILKNAIIVKKTSGDSVYIGSTVKVVKKADKSEKIFHVVGSGESDMASGKISHKSPLGEALIGKKKGDSVFVTTPMGQVEYTIKDLS